MDRGSVTGFNMTRLDSAFAPVTILNERGELSKNAQRRERRIQAGDAAEHLEHLECGLQPLSRDARLHCPIATLAGVRYSGPSALLLRELDRQKTRSSAGRRDRG